jgi:hypothetical protein
VPAGSGRIEEPNSIAGRKIPEVLNIAGPEFDLGNVVYVVLEDCEHRRRAFDDSADAEVRSTALARLARVKAAYDEFGGSPGYWAAVETEVMDTAIPQYVTAAEEMNDLERSKFGIWRGADPLARFVFALAGLTIGGIIIALPFIPIVERLFAFALAGLGFAYPEIKRWTHERRHAKALNRIVMDAVRYQQNARLHYMTTNDIRESFTLTAPEDEDEEQAP